MKVRKVEGLWLPSQYHADNGGIQMRIILVDDEKPALIDLAYCLKNSGDVEILGMYTKPLEALEEITRRRPDAVFVDIEMPKMNGLALAEEILRHDDGICIVFSTAFDEYALKAFEVNAIDYILKPVNEERVRVALNRIGKAMNGRQKEDRHMQREAIAQEAVKRGGAQIAVWKGDRILLCSPSEVEYIVAEGGQLSIVASKGESYTCKETLNYWENRLKQAGFFRTHKGYLVNVEKIKEIIPWFNNTYMLKMKGTSHEIPVSRGFVKEFRVLFDL